MSKSYKVSKKTMNMGPKKGKTVYSVRPYSYGTLTTKDIANQIAMESTATPADVMAVLDRYTYYVKENLKKGYDIELFGFGKLYLRFLTGKAVEKEKDATAKLVKSILPAFRPSYYLLKNGSRVYNLIPDSIELVKSVMRRRTSLLAVLPMGRRSLLQATLRMAVRTLVERALVVRTLVVRTLAAARILAVQVQRAATT